MSTRYEVTTTRLTLTGRAERDQVIEAAKFTQHKGTAVFSDEQGRPVAKIRHVVRICWA